MNATTITPWLKVLPKSLYKLGAQAWIDYTYPRHLFIETTAACNLACTYCPRERLGNHMDYRLLTQIVDEASQYGRRSFSLHLFGEPLLYPKILEAIEYIKLRNHTVLLTTNGTRLNQFVDDIIRLKVDQVLWSWRKEAIFTPETKEKLSRWGKFRVRFIKEVTPPEAYEEWSTWRNVEGRPLHNYGGNINIKEFSRNGDGTTSAQTAARWPCYHLWLAPAVAWNGNILLCCADPHQKETLGQFPKNLVADVWQSERIKSIRQGHLDGEYNGICGSCDVWKAYPNMFFTKGP